ncbi:MAG: aminotransferase class I/II-fold pyridoxal phosphate-dependent enzyme [Clostridium sp.]|jgi:cystathionine beta-lyase|nr:aminotransferase class I/II-fold pyridoxal phosphate-dependent enzyme [Clostridium sp.]
MTDFHLAVARRGTGSAKWSIPDGVLPLSIADAEWATAPAVLDAVQKRLNGHAVYGYSFGGAALRCAVAAWYQRVYGLETDPEWVVPLTGIVPALSALTALADGDVLANAPNYGLLLTAAERAGKRTILSPATRRTSGSSLTYEADYGDLERKSAHAGLYYFCNPHNPIGKVYPKAELRRIADFAEERGLIAVSDEIHCEIVYDRPHTPFFAAAPYRSVTLTSPGKICNMSGIPVAAAVVPDAGLRERVKRIAFRLGFPGELNMAAGVGAYSPACDEWKREAVAYLRGSRDELAAALRRRLPKARCTVTEGTYLQWIDLSAYHLGGAADFLLKNARVALTDGAGFGGTEDEVRLNFACPREMLTETLNRMEEALKNV